MSTKRPISMPSQKKPCNKKYSTMQKHYGGAVLERMHCCDFARYAFEAFLLLFLFFTLPHIVYGIANTNSTDGVDTGYSREMPLVQHSEPHFLPNRTVIVELFEWKFSDVSAECTNFLGPKGYAGVQLSPVTEHLKDGALAQSWLARYQPISFKFATRSGSIEDFLAMSRACNAAGVRVYVDVVLNHMAGNTLTMTETTSDEYLLVGTAGSTANVSALVYNGVPFDAMDFHDACVLENYFDPYVMRNCRLNGQPDLNHSKFEVHQRTVEFLNQLIELGVAGFRIDAAKYIWPSDLKDIFRDVNNLNSEEFGFEKNARPLFYQEVVDLGMDAVSKTEYSSNGIVTEYLYAAELSTIFSPKVPLSSLINWGPAMGFLPHQDALVFVDSHESQHGYLERELGRNQLLSYKQQRRYVMATAFMLAHPYGRIKRILSSYHFAANDKERGPPTATTATTTEHNGEQPSILSPEFDISEQCTPTNGWVCEHRWPAITNMLALVQDLSATEDGVSDFQTYGPNHIAFCRGRKAFIAINNDAVLDYATAVYTCMEPGVYCDVISGGRKADNSDCNGKRIVVKENGMADLILPALATIQNNEIDIENGDSYTDGYGDGNGGDYDNASEWEGVAVDVDYGVIAIYIGSKLANSEASVRRDAEHKPETDLKPQTKQTEINTEIGVEQVQVELTIGNSFVSLTEHYVGDEVTEDIRNVEAKIQENART